MHQLFGIDLDDDQLMASRSYFWLRDRVLSLLDAPATVTYDPRGGVHIMHGTRIGATLEPPA